MKSLRGRLLILAGVWLTAALLAAFLLISHLLGNFVTDRFDAETSAVADALIASVGIDSEGETTVPAPPADPRFGLPFSGWYWQVNVDDKVVARSPSLLDGRLSGAAGSFIGGQGTGADGAPLRVLRREITIPDSDSVVAITVTAPQDQIEESLLQIRRPLAISLIVLGLGLAAASVIQVTAGLRSLDRLGHDLRHVREGKTDRLPLPDVTELQPLTHEINAALDQNAAQLERSRHHLGNLAHSLKTPLAALTNELPMDHAGQALIARMDRLIGWHLRRARQAGPRQMGLRCLIRPVIDDILLVLRWPMHDKGITAQVDCPDDLGFAGERQDLEEMIGNLSENAVKWGRSQIRISARMTEGRLILKVEDDGPGMAQADAPKAMIRGARLDEFGLSGSGLGLAIVADLAALHGGSLRLERADIGGLSAVLDLPA
ncbi:sensor histidine kinase [Paracoccus seriniphilus]|uniref:histidine kinase n=1 Tax=Paracoccus seriniphilus TaxID=184748 RepID=A0A239PMW3_9RHOB|nr:HAMP domain-containing sensor histidine kinase [Paracoccus seriniphilus]WCR14932.1 HAMP domain-containing histidine kinase [Paracoccus seriniphilus]SNT71644.1 Signal transduction histidine kinase [Paracoccus seriniphilus]